MPKYTYLCKECEVRFEIRHSIKDVYTDCDQCNSANSLERVPSEFFLSNKQSNKKGEHVPGSIVKETIEEARQELRKDKESLKTREYKK